MGSRIKRGRMESWLAPAMAWAALAAASCWPFTPERCELGCPSGAASTGAQGGGGAGGEGGAGPVRDLFVDPVIGDDEAPGTVEAPLKTLGRAFSGATAGSTVHLFSGTYDATSGEDFTTPVPDGVAIVAVMSGGAVLAGSGVETGIEFAGGGRVEGLVIQGFSTAVHATAGLVLLVQTELRDNETALWASDAADVTVLDSSLANGHHAVSATQGAAVAMMGGEIHDIGAGCGPGLATASDTAALTMDFVYIHDCPAGIGVGDTASVTLRAVTFEGAGCIAVLAMDAAWVSLEDTAISQAQVGGAWAAIYAQNDSRVTMAGGSIAADHRAVVAEGTLHMTQAALLGTGGPTTGVQVAAGGEATLDGGIIHQFGTGARVEGGCRFRGVSFSNNVTGVLVIGSADLGTSADPGGNTLQGNSGVALFVDALSPVVLGAVGNTWAPGVQGAGADGRFPIGTTVAGPFGTSDPTPANVVISHAGPSVKLGADILP